MVAALVLSVLLAGSTTVELTPTDDVWVYPHASDHRDAYLRVWAAGGPDVATNADDLEQVSYAYLRFDVSKVPAGKVTEAKLTITHVSNPTFTAEISKKNPILVRPLIGDFTEKTWSHGETAKVKPEAGEKAIFGKGFAESIQADKEFPIVVDLTKGPNDFSGFLKKAQESTTKTMAVSLTSTIDVTATEQRTVYKFFSKDAETAAKRPVLRLTIE